MTTAAATHTDRIRDQALALPVKDRGRLAQDLFNSLDGSPTDQEAISLVKGCRAQALDLPAEDRETLARDLIASLDGPPEDPDAVAAAWGKEIRRRIALIDAGEAKFVSREEFRKSMQATLAATKCAK